MQLVKNAVMWVNQYETRILPSGKEIKVRKHGDIPKEEEAVNIAELTRLKLAL